MEKAQFDATAQDGVIALDSKDGGLSATIQAAKRQRIWNREMAIRSPQDG